MPIFKLNLSKLRVYLGNDDELNGIHNGWYCELVENKGEEEDNLIVDLINENIGNNPIVTYFWPKYDENKIKDDIITIVVQVNGKIRGKVEVNSDITDEEMKVKAFEIENVKNFTEGKEIIKVIVIPKKIVNIVVK